MGTQENNDFLVVGRFRRSHGIHGDILFTIMTDFPDRLKPGSQIFVGDKKIALKISRRKPHNDGVLLGFKEINNPEEAAKYIPEYVYVRADDRPALPEGEYYHHQILGLAVVDASGGLLGKVSEILVTGANDVYVVTAEDGKEILIPALKHVLRKIDLEAGIITVDLPDGLIG